MTNNIRVINKGRIRPLYILSFLQFGTEFALWQNCGLWKWLWKWRQVPSDAHRGGPSTGGEVNQKKDRAAVLIIEQEYFQIHYLRRAVTSRRFGTLTSLIACQSESKQINKNNHQVFLKS